MLNVCASSRQRVSPWSVLVLFVLKFDLVGTAADQPAPKKAKAADEPGTAGAYTAALPYIPAHTWLKSS